MLWKFGEGGEQPHLGQSRRASHMEALEGALGGFGGELIDFLNRGPANSPRRAFVRPRWCSEQPGESMQLAVERNGAGIQRQM